MSATDARRAVRFLQDNGYADIRLRVRPTPTSTSGTWEVMARVEERPGFPVWTATTSYAALRDGLARRSA